MGRSDEPAGGFTLVEILIVVVILGILTSIAVPMFADHAGRARREAFAANLRDLAQVAALYHQKYAALPPQDAAAPVPAAMMTAVGRIDFPSVTPLGGYWHVGHIPDHGWGVGVWWTAAEESAGAVKRDCEAVDAALDDGSKAGGRFVCDEGNSRYYWIIQ